MPSEALHPSYRHLTPHPDWSTWSEQSEAMSSRLLGRDLGSSRIASSSTAMAMAMATATNYVVTVQRPTAVSAVATGYFTAPNEHNLIVAKNTHLRNLSHRFRRLEIIERCLHLRTDQHPQMLSTTCNAHILTLTSDLILPFDSTWTRMSCSFSPTSITA